MKAAEHRTSNQSLHLKKANEPFFTKESKGSFFPEEGNKAGFFNPLQPKAAPNIQREEFGEGPRFNSLPGTPPRAQVYGPFTDEAIASALYGDPTVPIVSDRTQAMTVLVDYSRLLTHLKPYFSPSSLNTVDFLAGDVGAVGTGTSEEQIQERHAAALRLAGFARSQVTDTNLIDNFLRRTDRTNQQKAATMGEIIALHGKVEFLLGWIYEGGVQDPDQRGFENRGANRGAFPNLYQQEGGGAAPGGSAWCTSFAGYLYNTLGLVPENVINSRVFLSGYRLRQWATSGRDVRGNRVTPADETVAARAEDLENGAALIDRRAWKNIRLRVQRARSQERRWDILDEFFEDHPIPQAGDIIVIGGRNNNFRGGSSHTAIIESFDDIFYTLNTIEGNLGHAVRARTLDLTNISHLRQFILLARPGANFANVTEGEPDIEVNEADLTRPIQDIINRLVSFASAAERRWICSNDPHATAAEWMSGPLCTTSSGGTQSTN